MRIIVYPAQTPSHLSGHGAAEESYALNPRRGRMPVGWEGVVY